MKQFEFKGRIYSIIKCTVEDIPFHIERVSSYWSTANVDIALQTKLLEQCIDNGIAIKLVNKDITQAVIYGLHLKDDNIVSHLLWMKSKNLFSILAIYLRYYTDIKNILFVPHSKTYIPFEFMVNPMSIRRFHSHNAPLVINLYSPICYELGRVLFEEKGLKEI